jgi:hypothetical protein
MKHKFVYLSLFRSSLSDRLVLEFLFRICFVKDSVDELDLQKVGGDGVLQEVADLDPTFLVFQLRSLLFKVRR